MHIATPRTTPEVFALRLNAVRTIRAKTNYLGAGEIFLFGIYFADEFFTRERPRYKYHFAIYPGDTVATGGAFFYFTLKFTANMHCFLLLAP
jgi:hypothetical protein